MRLLDLALCCTFGAGIYVIVAALVLSRPDLALWGIGISLAAAALIAFTPRTRR